jgi:hypothetical protein
LLKINLILPGSGAWKQAEATKDNPDKVIILAHSDYKGNIIGPDEKIITPDDIVKKIKEHPDWKNGMPIELRVCAAADGNPSIVDKIKALIPNSTVSGPIGDVSPYGYTYWPAIPRMGAIPSSNPDHWVTK